MLEPSLYSPSSSSMFSHAGDKSEPVKRPLQTSYPNRFPRFSGSAPLIRRRSDYRHLSRDIQNYSFTIIRSQIRISCSISHCVFRYSDAVDSYSEISFTSPHMRLLAFLGFDTVASQALTKIQRGFVSLPLLLSPVHGYFYLR